MVSPDAEWMLWAKRFKIEHTHLLDRIKGTEELTVRITSLEEDTKDLAVSSKHVQEQNNVLKERVRQLEENAVHRELVDEEHSERFKAKVASLHNTLGRLIKTKETWMEEVKARCDAADKEVRELKARVEGSRRASVQAIPPDRGSKCEDPKIEKDRPPD